MKDAVLGAIDELYIGDMPPAEAARRLMDLADGLTLGECDQSSAPRFLVLSAVELQKARRSTWTSVPCTRNLPGLVLSLIGKVSSSCTHRDRKIRRVTRSSAETCQRPAGEVGSLEEVVKRLFEHQPPLLKPAVLNAIWALCEQAHRAAPGQEAARQLGCALRLIRMAAAKEPTFVAARLDLLLQASPCFALNQPHGRLKACSSRYEWQIFCLNTKLSVD